MNEQNLIWAEKYRPRSLSEVVGQDSTIESIRKFVKAGNIPHQLYVGPQGVGKTTVAHALGYELYGRYKSRNFIEVNASDERKIDDIRNLKEEGKILPAGGFEYKIVLLDEADYLARDSQPALRRIMEQPGCRFILSCNYPKKIIDPIKSRCIEFRFGFVEPTPLKLHLLKIAEKEGVNISKTGAHTIAVMTNGDVRKAVNTLQHLSMLNTDITDELVKEFVFSVDVLEIKKMFYAAKKGEIDSANKLALKLLYKNCIQPPEILTHLYDFILYDKELPHNTKFKLLMELKNMDKNINIGGNEYFQLKCFLATVAYFANNIK